MNKVNKKIISILLLLILCMSQLVVLAEDNLVVIKQTLESYLIDNGVDIDSNGKISSEEWKKIKNLSLNGFFVDITGIENAVNLKTLYIHGINPTSIDFSKLKNLEGLYIDVFGLPIDTNINFTLPSMNKLKYLDIEGYLGFSYVGGTFGEYYAFNKIDISNVPNLESLIISDIGAEIKFPNMENLTYLSTCLNYNTIDLRNTNIEYGCYIQNVEAMLHNITFPDNVYVDYSGEELEITYLKDISIKKGEIYEFYNMEPIYEENDIIEISNDSGWYQIFAKETGKTKIKFVDSLENEIEINVTVFEETIDKTLENTGITSKITNDGRTVLKSNGELWEMNSETTAEKIETNVNKSIWSYVLANGETQQVEIHNILKNDNTLKIKCENTEKVISNVADIWKNIYLTTSGDLYEMGANYITEEVYPKKIMSNVKKIINECIVLNNGTTWYQEMTPEYGVYATNDVKFKKLADFEIKDMGYIEYDNGGYIEEAISVVDLENTVWCCVERDYYFNESGLEKVLENFEGYEEENLNDGWRLNLENNNAVLYNWFFNEEIQDYELINSEIILTDVFQIKSSLWSEVLVRTDGSIWLYDNMNGLTKITKSTHLEEEPKEENEEIPFEDVSKKAWYYSAVKYNYENGMIKGTSETTFSPDENLSRGMLVTILWRMEKAPSTTENLFTDVRSSQYYYTAVNWAASEGIINGYGNGKFGPDDNITREQLAVILKNYAAYKEKNVSGRTDLNRFIDQNKIVSYARDAISWAVSNKIISGKENGTKIDPQGNATRSEAATMLMNYCLNVK